MMLDREKVIRGLEIHTGLFSLCKDGCPYFREDGSQCKELLKDALNIIKEQEAKLLTFEEVKNHFHVPIKLLGGIEEYVDFENDIEPLYLECDIEDAWTVHWRTYENTKEYLESWEKDYGKTWRCWTKKPTEEQKRSVKWE